MTIEEKFYQAYKTSELRHLHKKEDLLVACSKDDFELWYGYVIGSLNLKGSGVKLSESIKYLGIELKVFDTDTIKIIIR
jgi:hypothetical protein